MRFFLCLLCLITCSAAAEIKFKAGSVPEGFEEFLEPQTTLADVFFGGEYLASTLVEYTPSEVTFLNPEAVTSKIQSLLNPTAVASALQQPLESNAAMVCHGQLRVDCGSLQPNTIGIVFDENRFRINLFIHPSLLGVSEAYDSPFLPDPRTGNSFLQNLSLAYSGDNQGSTRSSLIGLSLWSQGRQRIQSSWSVDNNQGGQIETLYWQQDQNDYVYQAGLFRGESRNLTFIRNDDLLGGRFSTSLKTRTDIEFSKGSEVQVFLTTRSRVDLIKDGRLISSSHYASGNQILDTTTLPEGAYDLEIKIHDSVSGLETTVRRFFVKTAKLAPQEFDVFYIEAGNVRVSSSDEVLPENAGSMMIRGGYSHRLAQKLSLDAGLATIEDEFALEGGLAWVEKNYELEPKLVGNFAGSYGAGLNSFARYRKLSASLNTRRIWGQPEDAASQDYHLFRGSLKQQTFLVNYPVWEGQLSFQSDYFKQDFQPRSESYTLRYAKPLVRGERDLLDMSTELSHSNSGAQFYVRFNWSRKNKKWTHRASPELRNTHTKGQGSSTGLRTQFGSQWLDGDKYKGDLVLNATGEISKDQKLLLAEADYKGNWGRLAAETSYSMNDAKDNLGLAINYATSIVAEGGRSAWGGSQFGSSALLLNIDGDAVGSLFDVYINDQAFGEAEVGKPLVIGVQPYETYRVSLKAKGEEFVNINNDVKEVTLFPGNVKQFDWTANSVSVVIGQMFTMADECEVVSNTDCYVAVKNARIDGAEGLGFVDDFGFFQIELTQASKVLKVSNSDFECEASVPDYEVENGVAYLDKLLCL